MKPTERFSSRVDAYARYRPSYPDGLIPILENACGLTPDRWVADVGSGTGLLARLFLQNGNHVYGIEPNREMRQTAEELLKPYERFVSIDGRAEATSLPKDAVHFVTAGQAFHWFDQGEARREFKRILKPAGWVVLIWNERRTDTPFLRAYEDVLLRYSVDYTAVDHRRMTPDVIQAFFSPSTIQSTRLPNRQHLSLEGFFGRTESASYMPAPGHPQYDRMRQDLAEIFQAYNEDGTITITYDTLIYFGVL